MKKIIYIVLAALLFSCQEEAIEGNISLDSVYQIQDDPNDPVQHERYLIFKEFKVAVFFNDTIGTVLMKHDEKGEPIYRTEMIDLAWSFNGYTRSIFKYDYVTDTKEQMEFLQMIKDYVSEAGPKLTPFSILAVKSLNIIDPNDGKIIDAFSKGKFKNYFRTLLLTNDLPAATKPIINQLIMREMLKQKIANYKHLLGEFFEVSDKEWYSKGWTTLDATIKPLVVGGSFTAAPLYDDLYVWPTYYRNNQYRQDSARVCIREAVGRFGFVSGGEIGKSGGIIAPEDTNKDLDGYVNEMLKNPGEEFDLRWKVSPLVMKKYKVLRTVIYENIGIEL